MYDIQKVSLSKRIAAWMLDAITLVILAVFIALALSAITGFDGYYNDLYAKYGEYEEKYGTEFNINEDKYQAMTEEERANWDAAYKELLEDKDAIYLYNTVLNLSIMIVSLSLFIATALINFVVPLLFKNGMTLGKKLLGIAVVKTNLVRMSVFQLFVRTLLGKYTFELMIPVLIVIMLYFNTIGLLGTVILIGIILAQAILLIFNKQHRVIHDFLADTMCVDYASQSIFPDEEARIEYINEQAKIAAQKESYF